MIKRASSSLFANVLFSRFVLVRWKRALRTTCYFLSLWRNSSSKRWMYSKTQTRRKFSLFVNVVFKLLYLAILKIASWSIKTIVDVFLKQSIIWRIFLRIQTMSTNSNSIDQYLVFTKIKSLLRNNINLMNFLDEYSLSF